MQPLQNQMRGAVSAFNAGADKPGGRDMKEIGARLPVGRFGLTSATLNMR